MLDSSVTPRNVKDNVPSMWSSYGLSVEVQRIFQDLMGTFLLRVGIFF